MKTNRLVTCTLWVNRLVMAVVALLIFTLPWLLKWYAGLLGYYPPKSDLLGIWLSYIVSAAVIFIALWNMEKLMQNILYGQVFVRENVARVRRVQLCCGLVAAICLASTVFALPMVLFAAIMGFLCLTVSVLANVLDAAVALQEE
ncbi:MAG: DUF2975 domain-containing protein, partial [Oscillospiraceae bacterium]|nr:DUF2975 domain-containing protein [Oscillospiraceae bacterium]